MVVTNKRITIPSEIVFGNDSIKVVDTFKLLGITIDNKLNFSKHIATVCRRANYTMYSIKRLFYLPLKTKIQFFKTFILPIFDFCLTLTIYLAKYIINKLSNCYYVCLAKLLNSNKSDKFNFYNQEPTIVNNFLKKYKLNSFSHRLFVRLNLFTFNILSTKRPPILLDNFKTFDSRDISYNLRSNSNPGVIESHSKLHYGELTFGFFFSKFYNKILLTSDLFKNNNIDLTNFCLSLNQFKIFLHNNLNDLYSVFIDNFAKFNIIFSNFRFRK
jgi:hypothetical protein